MLKFWLGSRVPRRVRQSQMVASAQVLTLERRELLDGQTGSGSNNPYGSAPPSGPPHGSGTITVSKNQDPTLNTLAGNKTESSASGGTYQKVQKLYTNALFDVDVVYQGSYPWIKYTADNGDSQWTWVEQGAASRQGVAVRLGSGSMASLKAELYDPDGLKAVDDESVGVISVSTTGRSLLSGGGITEAGLAGAAEATIQSQVGGELSQIRLDLAHLGADMDAADLTTTGQYWESRITTIFDNAEADVVDAVVTTVHEELGRVFSALDMGVELRVAVSNPLLPLYNETEARVKAAVADYLARLPLLNCVQLDIPTSATIRSAFIQSASDGNLGDLRDNLTKAVTHLGIGVPLDLISTNGTRITGNIGASVFRTVNTQMYDIHLNVDVKDLKLGRTDTFLGFTADYRDGKRLNSNTYEIFPEEGFNFIIGGGVRF